MFDMTLNAAVMPSPQTAGVNLASQLNFAANQSSPAVATVSLKVTAKPAYMQ